MKITPRQYARALADSLERAKSPEQASAAIRNLLLLLRRHRRLRLLSKVISAFETEWSERRGEVRMSITCPEKFLELTGELEKNLALSLGKKVIIKTRQSPDLIGGLRILYKDTLIDGCVATQLRNLKCRLSSLNN